MADYTLVNLKGDVEDMAPKFGYSPGMESHFARGALELESSGVSYFKLGRASGCRSDIATASRRRSTWSSRGARA